MDLKELIGNIIHYRQNDYMVLREGMYEDKAGTYEEVEEATQELQTELTRVLVGQYYCTRKDCPCTPEYRIEKLVEEYRSIYKYHLYTNEYEYLVNKDYLKESQLYQA